jgi:DNA/RNA endonuclease YhcR with UshA esterase domain
MFLKQYLRGAALLAFGAVACADDPAPVFEIPGTGSVEGLVFFDADRDARFDPSSGDRALSGVTVRLLERGTMDVLAGGQTQTNASGRFELTGVPAGTHDLRIDTAGLGAGVAFCQNPVPVSVFISEKQFSSVAARAACIITIAEAEQTRDRTVVIQGIVTASPNQLRAGQDYTYVQDETGGIRIFGSQLANRGLEVGDRIEVTGTISVFSNDLQLGGPTLGPVQKNVLLVTPQEITTGELQSALTNNGTDDPLLGILVVIRKARIETVFGAPPINGRNVWINSGDGRAQMRIETGVVPGSDSNAVGVQLSQQYTVGKCYDITGVTGAFNADAQVFPRTLSDIVEVSCN